MSKKANIIGIVIAVAAGLGILTYTNIFEIAKPSIESSVSTAKDVISQVDGKDVVQKTEEISSVIKNITSQIEVTNPLGPKK